MTIRTQFLITMALFSLLLAVVAGLVVNTNMQLTRLNRQVSLAVEIERETSEINYLANDYLLFKEERKRQLWETKWVSLSGKLSQLEAGNHKQQAVAKEIKSHLRRVKAVFVDIIMSLDDKSSVANSDFIQVSWSRLAIQNQAIFVDALQLTQLIRDQRDDLRQTSGLLIYVLLGSFGAYFIVNYLIVQRRIFKTLADLLAGTEVIGSGNFDHSVAVRRKDEIGELAASFNQMTVNLKNVTASKTDLENEIAERAKVQRALHEERERLAVTLESIGDGVIATDIDANIIMINTVAENLTGWTIGEAKGKPLLEVFNIVNEITREPAEDPVGKALKTGNIVGLANHTALIAKDGSERSIADSCAPIRAADGNIIGAVLVFRDVTEQYMSDKLSDALNNISSAISSTLDFDEIMQTVVVSAAEAIGCHTASIEILSDGYWEVSYLHGLPNDLIGERFESDEAEGLAIALEKKEPFFINGNEVSKLLSPKIIEIFNVKSMMIMPIIQKGEVIAALRFVDQESSVEFNEMKVDFARKLAGSLSLALENSRLYQAERRIAQTLQEALLSVPKALPGIDFGHLYRSATEMAQVGGDFYDIFEIESGKIGIMIGDVAGKGISAATLTVLVENSIKTLAHQGFSCAEIMKRANEIIKRETAAGIFVSVFLGLLDINTGVLIYCSGGHPPAVIRDSSSDISLLETNSPVIGALDNLQYCESVKQLEKGDTLIVYTDGIIEARADREFFGEEKLLQLIKRSSHLCSDKLPQFIYNETLKFSNGKLDDDVAIMAMSLK